MKKARFTETQIVNILKLADSGMKVEDICSQMSFTFHALQQASR